MRNGEAPGDDSDDRPDLSQAAVNARLRAFVVEHREAAAKGDPRALRESDRLLAAMCENALAYQEEAERKRAEADAKLERMEYEQRGGQLQ